MKHGFIRCAAAAPRVRPAEPGANAEALIEAIRKAYREEARIIALPRLSLTGAACGDLFGHSALIESTRKALARIAAATEAWDALITLGMPIEEDGALFDAAVVLHRGKVLGAVPADQAERPAQGAAAAPACIHLLGESVPFGPDLLFAPAGMPATRIGITVGTDPDRARRLCSLGANLLVCLAAEPELIRSAQVRRESLAALSREKACAAIYAAAGAGESTGDGVYAGHLLLYEDGNCLAEAAPFGEGYAMSEPDLAYLAHERIRRGIHTDGRSECIPFPMKAADTPLSRRIAPRPFVPEEQPDRDMRADTILEIQARALAGRLSHTGCRAILGISGGADSTLALLVTLRALEIAGRPKSDCIPVTMPCFGTSHRTRTNAESLCEELGVPARVVDISGAVERHLTDIGHPLDRADTAFENAQARERTQVLMDLANMEGALVIGTGDLSELALGFATYNGDHMSMYGVNADVPKTAIRAILTRQAKKRGGEIGRILLDIVGTPVSPELLPAPEGVSAQITEEIVGPYDLVDFYLYHMIRRGADRDKILRLAGIAWGNTYPAETLARWLDDFIRRFFRQQFKRSCMPDGPAVGTLCLSPRGGWHMPADAGYGAWLE